MYAYSCLMPLFTKKKAKAGRAICVSLLRIGKEELFFLILLVKKVPRIF